MADNQRVSGLSARGYITVGGDLMALPHKKQRASSKKRASPSSGRFQGITTNSAMQQHSEAIKTTLSGCKQLEPYYPWAARNRPKETLTSIVGHKNVKHPDLSYDPYHGKLIQFDTRYPISTDEQFLTTNQAFSKCADKCSAVTGWRTNQGVASNVAKQMHFIEGTSSKKPL